MTTGERIRERRKDLGISADALAEKIGVSRSTMFRYENGFIEKLPINNLAPIASALNTTVEYLMGWDDDKSAHLKSFQDVTFDDFTYAFHNETNSLTEAEKELLLSMARKLNEAKKSGKETD